MRESNSHEDLAKVPGSHYINPPLNLLSLFKSELIYSQVFDFVFQYRK